MTAARFTRLRHAVLSTAAGAALALGLSMPAAAQLVVVDSRGADLPLGAVVQPGQSVTVPEGARIDVVGPDGAVQRIRGPYNGPLQVKQGGQMSVPEALKKLLSERSADTASLGAVRAASAVALPDPWVWDATRAGNVCWGDGRQIVLWRGNAAVRQDFTLMPADRSWSAEAEWAAGQDRIALPSDIPFADGDTMLVETAGEVAALTIHRVPATLTTDAMLRAYMTARGCDAQVAALSKK